MDQQQLKEQLLFEAQMAISAGIRLLAQLDAIRSEIVMRGTSGTKHSDNYIGTLAELSEIKNRVENLKVVSNG